MYKNVLQTTALHYLNTTGSQKDMSTTCERMLSELNYDEISEIHLSRADLIKRRLVIPYDFGCC